MDYGGTDRRKTKKDLKRKRLARVYKRGGQQRSVNIQKKDEEETNTAKKTTKRDKKTKRKNNKKTR